LNTVEDLVGQLKQLATNEHLAQMGHFGINTHSALGVKVPIIRKLAREVGKNHALAAGLWETGIHEARLLATMVEDPQLVTEHQFDMWVKDFDTWDICDQCCSLFIKTPFALSKIIDYSFSKKEFIKRTSFVIICQLAIHDNNATDDFFLSCFVIIERESDDNRNFVRKAVNWALRQIGKRNNHLRYEAIACAERIYLHNSTSARWIASDALRELKSNSIIALVNRRDKKISSFK
jgi:3-methyladenine DNA glycosylase AlkD